MVSLYLFANVQELSTCGQSLSDSAIDSHRVPGAAKRCSFHEERFGGKLQSLPAEREEGRDGIGGMGAR